MRAHCALLYLASLPVSRVGCASASCTPVGSGWKARGRSPAVVLVELGQEIGLVVAIVLRAPFLYLADAHFFKTLPYFGLSFLNFLLISALYGFTHDKQNFRQHASQLQLVVLLQYHDIVDLIMQHLLRATHLLGCGLRCWLYGRLRLSCLFKCLCCFFSLGATTLYLSVFDVNGANLRPCIRTAAAEQSLPQRPLLPHRCGIFIAIGNLTACSRLSLLL